MIAIANRPSETKRVRFVIVTLDAHLAGVVALATRALSAEGLNIDLVVHVASDWMRDKSTIDRCRADLATADLIVVTQLFMEDQVTAIRDVLAARADQCDAVMVALCSAELMKCTRMRGFSMGGTGDKSAWSPVSIMRRLMGGKRTEGSSGERQMAALRRVPKLLKFVPGTAQDVRAYYIMLQYWLAGSADNIANMIRYFVSRYATGATSVGTIAAPAEYPETGLYHPDMPGRVATELKALPVRPNAKGRVGLLIMRSYVLAENTAHYDAVIHGLESAELQVVPAFASALDNRAAVTQYFQDANGVSTIDALVSLTGFSLVGGPAYSDAASARKVLEALDVPYIVAQSLEFQSIQEWQADPRGLNSLQSTLQVAIPELEGATNSIVFAGKDISADGVAGASTQPVNERVNQLVSRVRRLVDLRRTARSKRKVAIVLFGFPPNTGNAGTAAYLDVFASLLNTMRAMQQAGYAVDVPESVDALRSMVTEGNAERNAVLANVHARVPVDTHVRREPWLQELEKVWGPAPGKQLTDGASLFVMGERFGNVFVGVQPAFGYEGDPMRLLFEKGFAPTHAFVAFYRWVREDFGADAILHFGTHGALEFMPGKQSGLDATCWPDRLIGDVPNVYLYASNNPSEGTLAKRRGSATLVSYLTPPITNAGLYRGLLELKALLDRVRLTDRASNIDAFYTQIAEIQKQAAILELVPSEPLWNGDAPIRLDALREKLLELEYALIPDGLHTVGKAPSDEQRVSLMVAMARHPRADLELPAIGDVVGTQAESDAVMRWVVQGINDFPDAAVKLVTHLRQVNRHLLADGETDGILRALDGRFIAPAVGGDVLRNPDVLPTGRNVFGFDPYRVPTAIAMREGLLQAERLLERHVSENGALPKTVALVLWGTDNMKSEGGAIAQALALMGAAPRFDGLGRLSGAQLIPLAELGRARVDVAITLSGVFRDLFPLQTRMLAEAALLCAQADEPATHNYLRANALAHMQALGCDLETASLRVFSNAEGAYGANVNLMVDSSTWSTEQELGESFARRKSFSYGMQSTGVANPALFNRVLAGAELSYQMLDSVELGATDVDQYFDSLGGLNRAVGAARGSSAPVYMGDQTGAEGKIRSLEEQVAFESRTRLLNPRWYEGMLRSGHEGVRAISTRVTNSVGWSATTGATPAWVYRDVAATFVLDETMRDRMAELNPHATLQMTGRLLEAHNRGYWQPDDATLDALRAASANLEDRIEGVLT
ncbi:MAG: magnesium chelatase subunit H [Phycisphaerae bacterium]|nr:magnesium chelatase subunit H [Gemmatimonadaceae bacterium]